MEANRVHDSSAIGLSHEPDEFNRREMRPRGTLNMCSWFQVKKHRFTCLGFKVFMGYCGLLDYDIV
jgi:hypothetical protein